MVGNTDGSERGVVGSFDEVCGELGVTGEDKRDDGRIHKDTAEKERDTHPREETRRRTASVEYKTKDWPDRL